MKKTTNNYTLPIVFILLLALVSILQQHSAIHSYTSKSDLVLPTQSVLLTAETASEQDAAETNTDNAGNKTNSLLGSEQEHDLASATGAASMPSGNPNQHQTTTTGGGGPKQLESSEPVANTNTNQNNQNRTRHKMHLGKWWAHMGRPSQILKEEFCYNVSVLFQMIGLDRPALPAEERAAFELANLGGWIPLYDASP